nr:hypothetical protein [Tanacetum cinerariifolium]
MLPKRHQTIFDALASFVGLYTPSFTHSNLMNHLPKFVYERRASNSMPEPLPCRSFMIDGIDGKFSILPREGGDNDEKDDSLLDKDNVVLIDSSVADKLKILKVSEPLKVTGKRKQVISHVTPPSWKHHLKDLIMEKLNDIREKSYMRQVVLDNFMNRRTRFREESPCSGPSCRGCDFVGACGKAAWPASSVSYSALLLVVSNSNLRAYVNSIPSELTIISPAPEPSNLEAPLVYNFHMMEISQDLSLDKVASLELDVVFS